MCPVRADADRTKANFFQMASFPNVIGCIDCMQVSIIGPSVNEHEFVNRKGVFPINRQLVCNADMDIMNAEYCTDIMLKLQTLNRIAAMCGRKDIGFKDIAATVYPVRKFR